MDTLNRRSFLSRTSLALLTLDIGFSKYLMASSTFAFDGALRHLESSMLPALEAIFPAVLGIQFKDEKEKTAFFNSTFFNLEQIITQLDPVDREALLKLYRALNSPVTKVFLTGFWASWENIGASDIRNMIERWKKGKSEDKRNAAIALTQLPALAWYTSNEAWPAIGYEVYDYNG